MLIAITTYATQRNVLLGKTVRKKKIADTLAAVTAAIPTDSNMTNICDLQVNFNDIDESLACLSTFSANISSETFTVDCD